MAATASRYLRIAYLTSRPYIRSPVRVHHATEHLGTIPHTLGSALRQDETSRLSYSPGSFPPAAPPRVVVSHACRVGGGAPQGWPPSAAQTQRAVFPHWAFTKAAYLAGAIDGI